MINAANTFIASLLAGTFLASADGRAQSMTTACMQYTLANHLAPEKKVMGTRVVSTAEFKSLPMWSQYNGTVTPRVEGLEAVEVKLHISGLLGSGSDVYFCIVERGTQPKILGICSIRDRQIDRVGIKDFRCPSGRLYNGP